MKHPKNDPKSFYPRYATDNCADCNDIYYTKWGRVRQTSYDLFLPDNNIIAACRNEKGFYPYRDERGLGMSELREPTDYVLAASGALSLGTTAGTDRSISAEFGGTTPHGLSEYYGVAGGIPASGAIDFSDFHGTTSSTTDFVWMMINIDNYVPAATCVICDMCCLFNCAIYPSGCDEHGNLAIGYTGGSASDEYGPSGGSSYIQALGDTPTLGGETVNGIYLTGMYEYMCCQSLACLRHWVDNGMGIVTDWIFGASGYYSISSWPPSWLSSCPNTFADRYEIVCGNVPASYSYGYASSYDLSGVNSSTHPMFCCVRCWCTEAGSYYRNYFGCCSVINPCVCAGANEWGCWGAAFSSLGSANNKLVTYGDPSNRYSGAGRVVAINGNLSNYISQGYASWDWSGDNACKNSKRLLVNSMVWATKGAL